MPTMIKRKWREAMKTAAGALLAFALYAYALDREAHIVDGQAIGQTIGASSEELTAAAQPTNCYCRETC